MENIKYQTKITSKDKKFQNIKRSIKKNLLQNYGIIRYLIHLAIILGMYILYSIIQYILLNPDVGRVLFKDTRLVVIIILHFTDALAKIIALLAIIPMEMLELKFRYVESLKELMQSQDIPYEKIQYLSRMAMETGTLYYSNFHKDKQLTLEDKESIKADIIKYKYKEYKSYITDK